MTTFPSDMTGTFTLPKSADRGPVMDRILQWLMALPVDKAWSVTVAEAKSERSEAQNRYLFGVAYELISKETGYERDDLHTYLLGRHFGVKLKRVPKSKYNPEGLIEIPVRTTTTDGNGRRAVLGKMQFAEFVDYVIRFASEKVGIAIPPPDPDYAERREEAA